ncbi:MAG: hypothetical protein QOH92_561 [Chloroflexota bacterium]|jgi:hypothetical protein|nr:hypothetical protein [Chloroflexota bacterium]
MNQLDTHRFRGLRWVERTGGHLTALECAQLLVAMAVRAPEIAVGFLRLEGWLSSPTTPVDLPAFDPPDSALAHHVEQAAAEQPSEMVEHSYRTWLFGLVLAVRDGSGLDPDLLYCAAMLHDLGLLRPTQGTDFTLAGAERAMACATAAGLTRPSARAIGDAICVHPTPGLSIRRDGALGFYLQAGAIADVSGIRLWEIRDSDVQGILHQHPRGTEFKPMLRKMMRAEAKAVPRGRFALLVRCGATSAIRSSIHGIGWSSSS